MAKAKNKTNADGQGGVRGGWLGWRCLRSWLQRRVKAERRGGARSFASGVSTWMIRVVSDGLR